MRTTDLINNLHERCENLTHKEVYNSVHAIFEIIGQALEDGKRCEFRDFGTFHIREHKAGMKRNPRTEELIYKPIRSIVRFKPGKKMRDGVDK